MSRDAELIAGAYARIRELEATNARLREQLVRASDDGLRLGYERARREQEARERKQQHRAAWARASAA